ncbi:hypothetical protein [Microbacterium sp. NIBRBAC000506063]|uniref:hypothetical protein n=1 Tax=Microbacterium sp. NIBRBAC000506063 TaxID=2734618 RepID=UPI002948B8A3|nr:hypothetical protein [Microbacterium sp. NIBRBAC000506063]
MLDDPGHAYTRELIAAARHEPREVSPASEAVLAASEVSKSFGAHVAVQAASFALRQGGRSGSWGSPAPARPPSPA